LHSILEGVIPSCSIYAVKKLHFRQFVGGQVKLSRVRPGFLGRVSLWDALYSSKVLLNHSVSYYQ